MTDSILPALDLPRFTFLCGTLGQGQVDLMVELVSRDDNLIRMDFTYPIHNMLSDLFPDTCPAMLDPLSNLDHGLLGHSPAEADRHDFPSLGRETIRTFMASMTVGMRHGLGMNCLGILAHRYIVQHDILQNFKRIIFTDAVEPSDIRVLINQYGENESLCIHLGSMDEQHGTASLPCRHIWLPEPALPRRVAILEKELTNGRGTGTSH
jgi:hypothetical protein